MTSTMYMSQEFNMSNKDMVEFMKKDLKAWREIQTWPGPAKVMGYTAKNEVTTRRII